MAQPDTKHDLEGRLDFIGLDAAARERLREISPVIDESMDAALDVFYAKVRAVPETARFFSNDAHIRHAKQKQIEHWQAVASGLFDESYVQKVSVIGATHARIGLEPRWYIGGYGLLLEQMVHAVIEKRWPSRFGRTKASKLADEVAVVVKAAILGGKLIKLFGVSRIS